MARVVTDFLFEYFARMTKWRRCGSVPPSWFSGTA